MFKKFLLSIFILLFVVACSTTPKDTAESSGGGSSGEFNTASTDTDTSSSSTVDTTTSDFTGIIGGSHEDLIVNVGDRVYFAYDSFDLDEDAKELLQHQAAWLKQYLLVFLPDF